MPSVSIIVPNYNHARFLRQRMESILDQTYQDFEVIVLDDASTDNSRAIIETYRGHSRISQIIFNACNHGVFAQWNRGVSLSAGELVWIAESDDTAKPDFLEKMVGLLSLNPGVVLAFCDTVEIDENDQRINQDGVRLLGVTNTGRWNRSYINNGRDECARYLIYGNYICNASACLFRKKAYLAAGGVDTEMRLAGDRMMWVNLLMRGDGAFYSEPLGRHRRHALCIRNEVAADSGIYREHYRVINRIAKSCVVDRRVLTEVLDATGKTWSWKAARDWDPAWSLRQWRVLLEALRHDHSALFRFARIMGDRARAKINALMTKRKSRIV